MTEEADGFGSARVGPLHAGQADIDPDLVRRLLAEQHPSLADRDPIDVSGTGTVNKMFRIGEDLCVRLPLLASGLPPMMSMKCVRSTSGIGNSALCPYIHIWTS